VAVRASRTATFACLKRGLVVHPGVDLAGEVTVVDIGAPACIAGEVGHDGILLEEEDVRPCLAPREPDSHKGTYGHLLVVAGSPGKTGAAHMAALAALRAGAGLVTVALPGTVMRAAEAGKPAEVMLERMLDDPDSPVGGEALGRLDALLAGKSAVAFGPGCGLTDSMGKLLAATIERASVPLVIDADGLTLLAGMPPEALEAREHPTVLTPHPGEMARLIWKSTADVQAERIPVAREYARLRSVHLVLKGSRTVIASPDGAIAVNPTGNPGMATAGTGDVLTGLIGGFACQGIGARDAACLSVYVHGLAGDRASEEVGLTALLAGDVLAALPEVISAMEP
jgi:NAD(P)H-hydrate epimerase